MISEVRLDQPRSDRFVDTGWCQGKGSVLEWALELCVGWDLKGKEGSVDLPPWNLVSSNLSFLQLRKAQYCEHLTWKRVRDTFGFILRVLLSNFIESFTTLDSSILLRREPPERITRSTYLDLLQSFSSPRMFLTKDVTNIDGRRRLQPAFTLQSETSHPLIRPHNWHV